MTTRFLGKLVGSQAARLRFLASPPEHMQSRPRSHVCTRSARRAPRVEKGTPANVFVFYEIDDDESKHELSLDEYGRKDVVNAWVLLEVDAQSVA